MIKFGTSGFRAIMGEGFTKESVQRVAYGVCQYAKAHKIKEAKIAVGFDARFMGEMYAKWAIEVLATKFKVKFFVKPVPTPVVSFEAKAYDFGFMITSSHNPFYYNGIKLFKKGAYECEDNVTSEIAEYANNVNYEDIETISYVFALEQGLIEKSIDACAYKESILNSIKVDNVRDSKVKVLINTMHGSSYTILKEIVEELNLKKVEFINEKEDPYFEHNLPAPYPHNLVSQAERVKQERFDVGFALDGDGDRFTLIDSDGEIYDCGYVAPLIYDFLIEKRDAKGGIVKNVAFSALAKKIADKHEQLCYDSKVGFKCIGAILRENDCVLGAESNGIALKSHVGSKDGLIACALVLDMLIQNEKTFGEILKEKKKELSFSSHVVEKAYDITNEQRQYITELLKGKTLPKFPDYNIVNVYNEEGLKLTFENDYWCMMRLSGTEPVIRTFAEMPNEEECNKVLEILENFLQLQN